jgi:hypothetical protein
MGEHAECSAETILAFAESEAKVEDDPYARKWDSFLNYSVHL